jgi:glutathione S-transferase
MIERPGMSLTLHFHPLSSFCQKVLVALYENDTPFRGHLVNLGEEKSRADFLKIWPIGKFPVLHDTEGDRTVAESTIIIEYLAQHYQGKTRLIPAEPDRARETRMCDRFYDLHVHLLMQKIVGDRLRPPGEHDPHGVADARRRMTVALDMIDRDMAAETSGRAKTWAMGDDFTMADCSAAPALYYANLVQPFAATHENVTRYFERLMARPSFARAVKEADPYRHLFPREAK